MGISAIRSSSGRNTIEEKKNQKVQEHLSKVLLKLPPDSSFLFVVLPFFGGYRAPGAGMDDFGATGCTVPAGV